MAERHGAIGIITLLTPKDSQRRPWARRVAGNQEAKLTWLNASGEPYRLAPGIKGAVTIDVPAGNILFAGAKRPLSAIFAEAARKGGKPRGFALKQSLKLERQGLVDRITSPNVVAILPGPIRASPTNIFSS
jgi:hypothetical protein